MTDPPADDALGSGGVDSGESTTGRSGEKDAARPDRLAARAEADPASVDMDRVFAALAADDETVRHGSATALVAVARNAPDRLAAHPDVLADLLRADDDGVGRAALVAVRDAGRADVDGLGELVGPLRERLGDQRPDEAKLTGAALGAVLDPDSPALAATFEDFAERLRTDPAGSHGYALIALGATFPAETVARLDPLLSASDAGTVQAAAQVLAAVSSVDPEAAAGLAPAATDLLAADADRTARFAAELLSNVVEASPEAAADAVDRLATPLAAAAAATRRAASGVACSLARADPDSVAPLVPALVDRLSDPDRLVRRDACYALGVGRVERARAEIEAVGDDAGPELSAVADRALARIDGETAEPPLPEIPPGEVFQHSGGPAGDLTPEEREEIRRRRLRRREGRSRSDRDGG